MKNFLFVFRRQFCFLLVFSITLFGVSSVALFPNLSALQVEFAPKVDDSASAKLIGDLRKFWVEHKSKLWKNAVYDLVTHEKMNIFTAEGEFDQKVLDAPNSEKLQTSLTTLQTHLKTYLKETIKTFWTKHQSQLWDARIKSLPKNQKLDIFAADGTIIEANLNKTATDKLQSVLSVLQKQLKDYKEKVTKFQNDIKTFWKVYGRFLWRKEIAPMIKKKELKNIFTDKGKIDSAKLATIDEKELEKTLISLKKGWPIFTLRRLKEHFEDRDLKSHIKLLKQTSEPLAEKILEDNDLSLDNFDNKGQLNVTKDKLKEMTVKQFDFLTSLRVEDLNFSRPATPGFWYAIIIGSVFLGFLIMLNVVVVWRTYFRKASST